MDPFSYLEPVCCSMSSSNCCFLTCIQVSQEASQVAWYSHLSQNFPQFIVIHTVKGFGIANKAEKDAFLELSYFLHDPMDGGNLISGSSAFSKTSLNIWKFMVQVLLKPGLENFEHYFTSMWDECNCAVVWAFFGIALGSGLLPRMASAPWTPLYFWVLFVLILLWHRSLGLVRCWAGPDMYKHLTQELGFWMWVLVIALQLVFWGKGTHKKQTNKYPGCCICWFPWCTLFLTCPISRYQYDIK